MKGLKQQSGKYTRGLTSGRNRSSSVGDDSDSAGRKWAGGMRRLCSVRILRALCLSPVTTDLTTQANTPSFNASGSSVQTDQNFRAPKQQSLTKKRAEIWVCKKFGGHGILGRNQQTAFGGFKNSGSEAFAFLPIRKMSVRNSVRIYGLQQHLAVVKKCVQKKTGEINWPRDLSLNEHGMHISNL